MQFNKMRAAVFALALMGALGAASLPAQAAPPPSAESYGKFTCSNGQTIEPFGNGNNLHFPERVGFVNGRGVVAKWVSQQVTGTLTLSDPTEAVPITGDFQGPTSASHRTSSLPNLGSLIDCTTTGEASDQVTVDAGLAAELGLDESYIGRSGVIEVEYSRTVWITPGQLTARNL